MSSTVAGMWARVQYSRKYHDDPEDVPVSKIEIEYESKKNKRPKRRPFKPCDTQDYCDKMWYVVWSKRDTFPPEESPYYAQIGRLSLTKEGLDDPKQKRVKFPVIPDKEAEPDSALESCSDSPASNNIQTMRNERLQSKKLKRAAEIQGIEGYYGLSEEGSDGTLAHSSPNNAKQPRVNEAGEISSCLNAILERMQKIEEKLDKKKETEDASTLASLSSKITNLTSTVNTMNSSMESIKKDIDQLKEDMSSMRKSPLKAEAFVLNWVNSIPDNLCEF